MEYLKRKFGGEYFIIALTLIVGIMLSAFAGWIKHESAEQKILHDFHTVARDRIEVIKDAIQNHIGVVKSVASFYDSSDYVSRDEFRIFTSQLLKDNPYIQAIEWLPIVKRNERSKYEKDAADFMSGFTFKDPDGTGGFILSTPKDTYYPVYYIEPFQRNSDVFGVDASTRPISVDAFNKAVETRQITATAKIKLLLTQVKNKTGIAVFIPIYHRDNKSESAVMEDKPYGFVGTVAPLERLVDAAIEPLSKAGVHVLIHDLSSSDGKDDPLYVFSSRLQPTPVKDIINEYMYDFKHATEKAEVNVAGRHWEITVIAATGNFELKNYNSSILPTATGLMFTLVLCMYLISRINETARITGEVNTRTEILNRTKKEIELILHSSRDAIIGIDSGGHINLCNPMALSLLGYSRKDLMGQHHRIIHYSETEGAFFDPSSSMIARTITEGVPSSSHEENFWKKDGSSLLVEYTVAPLIDEGIIKGAVMVFRDITERRKQLKQLEQLASYDHLTGVANRALFIELLKKSVSRAHRTNTKVGVIFIDLNNFKPVNDNYGHRTGDLLLKAFADRVKNSLRLYDTLARMGGDEFIILAENIHGEKDCEAVITRIHNLFEAPINIEGNEFNISAAIGISIFPDDATDLDSLINHADNAMYTAKKQSHRFHFYKKPIE